MGAGPADNSLPNQIPQTNNMPPNSNMVGMEYQGAAYDQSQMMVGAENPEVDFAFITFRVAVHQVYWLIDFNVF